MFASLTSLRPMLRRSQHQTNTCESSSEGTESKEKTNTVLSEKEKAFAVSEHQQTSSIRIVVPPTCTPVVVFCNKLSGGGLGQQLLHEFKSALNPIQVFDLSEGFF